MEWFEYWSSEEGQRKRKKLNRAKSRAPAGKGGARGGRDRDSDPGLDIPLVLMKKTLDQCQSVDTILVSATIPNLLPGLLYRFRVAGVNAEGQGEWSDSSYSQSTLPSHPERPRPPIIEKKDLTWILFKWSPPPDNGSALVGYRSSPCPSHLSHVSLWSESLSNISIINLISLDGRTPIVSLT